MNLNKVKNLYYQTFQFIYSIRVVPVVSFSVSFSFIFIFIFIFFTLTMPSLSVAEESKTANSNPVPAMAALATAAANATGATKAEVKKGYSNFEWDPMPGAKSYEVEIKPAKGETITDQQQVYKVETTSWAGKLKPGKYTMRLRSKDHRGVPGEWSESTDFNVKLDLMTPLFPIANDEIKTNQSKEYSCEFKWEADADAKSYQVKVFDASGNTITDSNVKENTLTLNLPIAAKYSWTVIGIDSHNQKGKPLEKPILFTLLGAELKTPILKNPNNGYVRQLSWSPSEGHDKYIVKIEQKDNISLKWKTVQENNSTDTKMEFPKKWKGGQYKASITAVGNLRAPSKTHSIIFPVVNGDRSAAAEARSNLRQAINRTNGWYLVGSYLITQISYQSVNYDQGSIISTTAFGGTGRLGAGYLSNETSLGFLGIVDLSGFIIGQKNYTYPSLEGHGIYRYTAGPLGEFRLSSGLFYKEIPEILANGKTGEVTQVTQIGTTGLHFGGEYWYSMTSKLGLQFNARFYYPLSGKTPNGEKIIPTMSYQYGFLGSYRLNQKMTGLMGYVYRKDIVNYNASSSGDLLNSSSNMNQSSVVGQYLNFFLEWNL